MTWVLIAVATWLLLSIVVALLVGRSIRLADREEERAAHAGAPNFTVDPAPLPPSAAIAAAEPAADDTPPPAAAPSTPPPSPATPAIPAARQGSMRGCVQPGERRPSSRRAGLI
jgi:hypothetical protein